MVRVKICGIQTPEQAVAAARLGADLLGLVFAPSRRQISREKAEEIVAALKGEPRRPELVGVFVDQPWKEVNATALICELDYVQLHGDETPKYCGKICQSFIKTLWWAPWDGEDEFASRMDRYYDVDEGATFLLDTHVPGVPGGSGQPWDWKRAAWLARDYPLLVAGGLTPKNVAGVVQATHPWGVDVSSGVETNGQKDPAKIKAFIEAVRAAGGPDLTAETQRTQR